MDGSAGQVTWFVYLVECRDGSWYTGVARDVRARLEAHNQGRGARYTRGRTPVSLLAESPPLDKVSAFRLEYRVKRLPRARRPAAVRQGRAEA